MLLIVVIPQVILYSYFVYKIFKLLRIHFFNALAIRVKKVLMYAATEHPVENASVERELSESFLN